MFGEVGERVYNGGKHKFTTTTGPIHLDGVDCAGTEKHILDCPRLRGKIHNCGHGEDVAIKCKAPVHKKSTSHPM